MNIIIKDLSELQKLANLFAEFNSIYNCKLFYLSGDLGVGKTTFIRFIIQAYGYSSHVVSPSYTYIQEYEINSLRIIHADLYRLETYKECVQIGLIEYLSDLQSICLIEWASKITTLPKPDIDITIEDCIDKRIFKAVPNTKNAEMLIDNVAKKLKK